MLTMGHVATRIQLAGLATPGASLFIYQMPDPVTRGLLIVPGDGFEIDHEMRGILRGSFQVIARATSPVDADAFAASAAAIIVTDQGWTTLPGGTLAAAPASVLFIRQRHTPIVYPRTDIGDLHEASVNFDTMFSA